MNKITYKILVIFMLLSMSAVSMAENSNNVSVAEKMNGYIENMCNAGEKFIAVCGANYFSKKICNPFVFIISACSAIYAQGITIEGVTIAQNINKSKKYANKYNDLISQINYANAVNNLYLQPKYVAKTEIPLHNNRFNSSYNKYYREGLNAWHLLGLGTVKK